LSGAERRPIMSFNRTILRACLTVSVLAGAGLVSACGGDEPPVTTTERTTTTTTGPAAMPMTPPPTSTTTTTTHSQTP
jgi:hypothetical protein